MRDKIGFVGPVGGEGEVVIAKGLGKFRYLTWSLGLGIARKRRRPRYLCTSIKYFASIEYMERELGNDDSVHIYIYIYINWRSALWLCTSTSTFT